MAEELSFRVFLLVIAIVQNAFSFRYLKRASVASSIFQRRDEGILMSIVISATFAGYCIAVAAYLLNPSWMAWSAIELPNWIRWFGTVPLLDGSFTIMWGVYHLGNNITFSVSTKAEHKLITSGPYRWVRHPLYTGLLLGAIGVSVMLANWFVATTGLATWILLARRTRLEEQNLIEKFGDAYREYMTHTGQFFPRVR